MTVDADVRVTFTERVALERMVKYIEEERARLWDEYIRITNRLAELDAIENINPTKVEAEEEKSETQVSTMTLEEAVRKHSELHRYTPEASINSKIKLEIEKLKDYETPKKSNRTDVRQAAVQIAHILKEAGRPVKMSDIVKMLEDKGIKTNNPYVLMQQARNYEPKIERAKFGYYQYRH